MAQPDLILTPFGENAAAGTIEPIPETLTPGDLPERASWNAGFPAVTMTELVAGGIPPRGQDFNGVLNAISQHTAFTGKGGRYKWDAAVAAAGGYALGAVVQSDVYHGNWVSIVEGNTTNPNTGGAGWKPEISGSTLVTMTNANVTLTANQALHSIIIVSGTLTANLQLIMPGFITSWIIVNRTSGAFSLTVKTAFDAGIVAPQGVATGIYCDGMNIRNTAQTSTDYLNTTRIDVASGTTVNLTNLAPNTRNIRITGSQTINAFTIAVGQTYFVSFAAALTLRNNASITTNRGADLAIQAGDSCVIRATASGAVEVIAYSSAIIPLSAGGTGATTAEGARTALGLGTAALGTLTESRSDSTLGRVMRIGDAGIGAANSLIAEDLNNITASGIYGVGSSTANTPTGAPSGSMVLHLQWADTVAQQVVFSRSGDVVQYRRLFGGEWSAWAQFYMQGNLPEASQTSAGIVQLVNALDSTSTAQALTAAQGKVLQDTKAPLASPALTGNPTVPNQTSGNNSTRAANTAFVTAAVSALETTINTLLNAKAPLASPALTGNPTATTQPAGNNSTRLATTAFVGTAINGAALGMSQTYANVTASRAAATNYTNSSSRPMMVLVSLTRAAFGLTTLLVSGAVIQQAPNQGECLVAIVPPGATYRVNLPSSGVTILQWTELS